MAKKNNKPQVPKLVNDYLMERQQNPQFKERFELERLKAKLGNILIECRIKRNLTQGELAKLIGYQQQDISRFEHGNASADSIITVLSKLGVFLDILVDDLKKEKQQCDGATQEFAAHLKFSGWAQQVSLKEPSQIIESKEQKNEPLILKKKQ